MCRSKSYSIRPELKQYKIAKICAVFILLFAVFINAGNAQCIVTWGGYGSGDGQLIRPFDVAVDSDGYAYVADRDNHRVQKFTSGCIDTLDGLQQMIDILPDEVLSDEIKNSLVSKVNNALKSVDKEKDNAAINMLEAFINEIEAQRGKKMSEEAADMLIGYANNVIAKIKEG